MKLYLSLGTNLGERERNLEAAIDALSLRFGVAPTRCSSIIETEAQGFQGPAFLNCAVLFELPEMDPMDILRVCQDVEIGLGRAPHSAVYDSEGKRIYNSRIIDIDILLIDNQQINTKELVVPHPHMRERDFVMIPLNEIIE